MKLHPIADKSVRCAALFVHPKTMMISKMKLSLLQLLRQDMSLYSIDVSLWVSSTVQVLFPGNVAK